MILVTSITQSGNAIAQKLAKPGDVAAYLPLDYSFIIRRAFDRVRPDVFSMVEAEIWPNLLAEARRRGVRTVLINGRISDHGYREFRYWGWMLFWAYSNIDRCCMQTKQDVKRILSMGIRSETITLCGNTKFDQENARISDDAIRKLRASLGIPEGVPSIVAGSTNKGEEEPVLKAFYKMRKEVGNLRLIIAPRQIDRTDEIRKLVESFGLNVAQRSAGKSGNDFDVLILDTFGELAATYAVGEIAFVGGTLICKGGHSIVQPILQGKPVLFGPHTFKTRDIARMAIDAGIGFEINDADEFAEKALELLQDDGLRTKICSSCMEMVANNKGASARCAAQVVDFRTERRKARTHSGFSFVGYLESVVYSGRKDLTARLIRGTLGVLSSVYSGVISLYLLPFKFGARKTKPLPCPVISVGNITSGGTGKTPVVQYLCRRLAERGLNPGALSYGYGGVLGGRFGIVSDKETVRLDAEMAGDEPAMLASTLPGVPVVVCKDRSKSGAVAVEDLGADVLVLDDGFQVWTLRRNFDIVLLSSDNPFDNGRTLPAGLLREPLSALERADCVIVTGSCEPDKLDDIFKRVHEVDPKLPVFVGRYKPTVLLSPIDGRTMDLETIRGKRVIALSSIAKPLSFEGTLQSLGAQIIGEERFGDHHVYYPEDIAYINRHAEEAYAEYVVTTDKDAIKLDGSQFSVPLLVLRIEIELESEPEFWGLVSKVLGDPVGSLAR
jgi:tetraacyldisaccharide 4'-kinase